MPYFDQLSEIFGYFWEQINWESLPAYYPYAIIFLSCTIFLFVLIKIFQSKRRVKEYIEDRICLKIDFAPMGSKEEELKSLLAKLYKLYFDAFRRKYYFAFEVLIRRNQKNFYIVLSRRTYEKIIAEGTLQEFSVKDVTSDRDKFFSLNGTGYSGFEAELSKDFIYPFQFAKSKLPLLEDGETIFVQLLARPQGENWKNLLDRAIILSREGKSVELSTQAGCITGFLQVVAPFFSFLGDTMTFTIHGSGPRKEDKKENPNPGNEDDKTYFFKDKKDEFGFETCLRVLAWGLDEERNYLLLEGILDMFDSEGDYNSYIVDKAYTKPKKSFFADIELANLNRLSVDILNRKEIAEIVSTFFSD